MKYADAQKAQAVGIALAAGDYVAAERTGLPRRSISRWRAEAQAGGRLSDVVVESRAAVAGRLWTAVTVGVDEVLRRMRDPKARLSDVAQALRVVSDQHALLTGNPTANVQSTSLIGELDALYAVDGRPMTDAERVQLDRELRTALDATLTDQALGKARSGIADLTRDDVLGLIGQIEAVIREKERQP